MGHRVGAADSISAGDRKHLHIEGACRLLLARPHPSEEPGVTAYVSAGRYVTVYNHQGRLHCLDSVCYHAGGPQVCSCAYGA